MLKLGAKVDRIAAAGLTCPGLVLSGSAGLAGAVAARLGDSNRVEIGDSVFVVANLNDDKGHTYRGVRQQFVKVQGSRGDQVGVVEGLINAAMK